MDELIRESRAICLQAPPDAKCSARKALAPQHRPELAEPSSPRANGQGEVARPPPGHQTSKAQSASLDGRCRSARTSAPSARVPRSSTAPMPRLASRCAAGAFEPGIGDIEVPAPLKDQAETDGIDPGRDRGRHGDADMADELRQHKAADDVDDDRSDGEPHRRPRVLAGEKAGLRTPWSCKGGKPGGEGGERVGATASVSDAVNAPCSNSALHDRHRQ